MTESILSPLMTPSWPGVMSRMPVHGAGLRVLAIAEDLRGLVTACRVLAPLLTLKRLGIVEEFLVTDSTLVGLPRDFAFDVLWVQRAPDPRLSRRIAERFHGAYLHDMDDLLVTAPGYIAEREFPERGPLVALIEGSAVFTAPSRRLVELVERAAGVPVAGRTFVCPNALEFPLQPPRIPERPRGLVFTQSHRLALTESREEVLGAVREFAALEKLPLFYFGPPPEVLGPGTEALLGPVVGCGYLDFWRYHSTLAAWPPMIGVAPLETTGDPVTLDFIAGKSDVKMVEYGGFGHPSVYSRAAPYGDTDLCAGVLVDNTASAWSDALAKTLDGGWRGLAAEQQAIIEARSLDRVAVEYWAPALRAARIAGGRRAADLSARRLRR
jgi:hypothetical protein